MKGFKQKKVVWVSLVLIACVIFLFIFVWFINKDKKDIEYKVDRPDNEQIENTEHDENTNTNNNVTVEDIDVIAPIGQLYEIEDSTVTIQNIDKSEKNIASKKIKLKEGYKTNSERAMMKGFEWLSTFNDNVDDYFYGEGKDGVRIGDWVFLTDNHGEIIHYIPLKKVTKEQIDKLDVLYPWGEYVETSAGNEWLRPSYRCSLYTVGWDYEKYGINPDCPKP